MPTRDLNLRPRRPPIHLSKTTRPPPPPLVPLQPDPLDMSSEEFDVIQQSASVPSSPTNLSALYSIQQHDLFHTLAPPTLFLLVLLAALIFLWDPTPLPPVPSSLPPGTSARRIARTHTEAFVLALRAKWPAGVPGVALFGAACLGALALLRGGIAGVAGAATGFRELRVGREVRVGRGRDARGVTGDEMLAGLFVR